VVRKQLRALGIAADSVPARVIDVRDRTAHDTVRIVPAPQS